MRYKNCKDQKKLLLLSPERICIVKNHWAVLLNSQIISSQEAGNLNCFRYSKVVVFVLALIEF